MDQEQKPRERSFIRELVPEWRPTREQMLWTIRIIVVLVLLLGILTIISLPFGISLWEWVKLLIVPAAIAAGSLWFNRQQRDREMHIAEQRAQDEALQAYLDQMSQLLTDKERPLGRAQPGDNLSAVARAQTLTVLTRLDGGRKRSVVEFLYESGLIKDDPVLSLRAANLEGADLRQADLTRADLREANLKGVDLRAANLAGAKLEGANLENANLRMAALDAAHMEGAVFTKATLADTGLSGADLVVADLQGANLEIARLGGAFLHGANLQGADLSGAYLLEATLGGTDLSRARLYAATVTEEQLSEASSLEGATMPNGQKYEDWLKGKVGRGEDGEDGGF